MGRRPVNEDSGVSGKLEYLKKYHLFGSKKTDVPKLCRTMFEESAIIAFEGIVGVICGFFLKQMFEENLGNLSLLTVPVGIFTILLMIAPFESDLLWGFGALMNYGKIYNPLKQQNPSKRRHRIFFYFIFLILLSLIDQVPVVSASEAVLYSGDGRVPNGLKSAASCSCRLVLHFSTKFMGTCTMITIYRLYLDLLVESASIVTGKPFEPVPQKKTHNVKTEKDVDINFNKCDQSKPEPETLENVSEPEQLKIEEVEFTATDTETEK